MSVSIHPAGLYDPNSPLNEGDVQWQFEEYPCLCTQCDQPPRKDCWHCKGTGIDRIKNPPIGWEMNLANGNFSMIANAIGFADHPDDVWGGSICPNRLLELLDSFDPSLGVRETRTSKGKGGCHMIEMGCPPEQVARYVDGLRMIAYVSLSRGVDVEWA